MPCHICILPWVVTSEVVVGLVMVITYYCSIKIKKVMLGFSQQDWVTTSVKTGICGQCQMEG